MSLMSCATVAVVERLEVVKPPRLNFARVCLWCWERDCESPKCIDAHDRSEWTVCDDCDGFHEEPCYCVHGVIEAARSGAAKAWA